MEEVRCPNCNSTQKFARQREFRIIPNTGGTKEIRIFIRCSKCRWESELFRGTEEQHRLQRRRGRLLVGQAKGAPVQRAINVNSKRIAAELAKHTRQFDAGPSA